MIGVKYEPSSLLETRAVLIVISPEGGGNQKKKKKILSNKNLN